MLFVTHDFGVVAQLCDAITVMYAGQTVETGPTSAVLADPRHPYNARAARLPPRTVRMPLPASRDLSPRRCLRRPGADITPRCPLATDVCSRRAAHLVQDAPDHLVGCRLADERQEAGA